MLHRCLAQEIIIQFDYSVAKGKAFGLDGFGDFGHNRFALCKMDEGRCLFSFLLNL
jgi:hypothetical protein